MSAASVSPAPARKPSANPLAGFYRSSIGKKWVVAITGTIWIGYVFGHLAGNLLIFLGPERLNAYALFLHSTGPMLWVIRFVLLTAFVTHVVATIQLTLQNRRARPKKYARPGYQASTTASRSMIVTGLIVLCFVVYHLLHFTLEVTNPGYSDLLDGTGHHDVYRMEILAFRHPLIVTFYVLGTFLLCGHLSHGIASVTQTFGLNNRKLARGIGRAGTLLAWVAFAGFASIPLSVLFGLVR